MDWKIFSSVPNFSGYAPFNSAVFFALISRWRSRQPDLLFWLMKILPAVETAPAGERGFPIRRKYPISLHFCPSKDYSPPEHPGQGEK